MRRLVAIAACALLASGAQAGERERTDAPPLEPYKIILVGDSTMAPHSGWGGAFCAHHVKSSVACLKGGRGGRPARSYWEAGSLDIAAAGIGRAGGRVTVCPYVLDPVVGVSYNIIYTFFQTIFFL